ncbi:MAG: AAA family ATPase [Lacisediminihabitans sp.]
MPSHAIGVLLREHRQRKDLTIEALSALSGVSDRTVSDVERGVSTGPHPRTMAALANALELDDADRSTFLEAARVGRRSVAPANRLLPDSSTALGRDAQVDSIRRFIAGIATSGAVKVLLGEPGVGKSLLLEIAASIAAASHYQVLTVSGVEYEADLAYSGLHQLLLPLTGDFPRLDRRQRAALEVALGVRDGIAPSTLVVCTAVLALLQRAARQRPILLIVDDVPWLDRASAVVLGFVARRLRETHVGMLAAVRTDDHTLFDTIGGASEVVPELVRADAVQLLARSRPALSRRAVDAVLGQAHGNPLAVLELGRELDRLAPEPLELIPEIIPMSERLERAFAFRFAELSATTRAALLTLALESRSTIGLLIDVGFTIDDLTAAESAGLIHVNLADGGVWFRHPLVRSAVVSRASAAERQRTHLSIAARVSDDPDRRAWHLADGQLGPDEETAQLLADTAAGALARGDRLGATRMLIRSAQLTPDPTLRATRMAEVAYLGAEVTGDTELSSDLLTVLRSSPGAESLHATVAAALMDITAGGDYSSVQARLVHAVEHGDHGWRADNAALIDTLTYWVTVCWVAGRVDFWPPLLAAVDRLVPRAPALLAASVLGLGDPARTGAEAAAVLSRLRDELGDASDVTVVERLNLSGVFVDLIDRAATLRVVANDRGGPVNEMYLRSLSQTCVADFFSGRWAEAQALCDEGVAATQQAHYAINTWYFSWMQSLLAAVRGDASQSSAWAADLDAAALTRGAFGQYRFGLHAKTLAAAGEGDWESAYRAATTISPPGVFAPYVPTALWVAYDLVDAAMRTGRRAEARAHHAAMVELDLAGISSRLALVVAGTGALVADDDDHWETLFEGALSTPDAASWPFEFARIQLAYGERLRRHGEHRRAARMLGDARRTFDRLGALPWSARARA